jgi:hypothetical protein
VTGATGATSSLGTPVQVEQTERSFAQATEGAMGNDILVGLIELITNCDDQYGDQSGSILVRFPKPEPDGTWAVEVRDKATGIAYGDIEPKLLRFGGRTSGHERGESKRGNRGRGGKDVSHFGRIRWDMIKDGKYSWVWLDRHGRGEKISKPLPADAFRSELGIPKNGVVATVACDRARIRRPQRDRIRQKLEYAVQLRNVMSNSKRTVKFQYGDEEAINLRYLPPTGMREHPSVEVEVTGYQRRAVVTIAEVPTPFQEEPGDLSRQGGLLIKSGRAVHEATLYGFENNAYAGYFLGFVHWDTIEDLSREFDDRDEAGDPIDPANPMQIIRADRRGLNAQHPAVKALRAAVEGVLRPHFERKAREMGGGGRESRATKQRLDALARIVARFQASKAEELEFELSQHGSQGVDLTPEVPILEVIPPRKLLEYGRVQTFSVRLRQDALFDEPSEASVALSLAADPEGCVELSGTSCVLTKDARLEGRLTGTFSAKAMSADGTAIIEVTHAGLPGALVEIETVEPEEPVLPPAPAAFSFERPSYRVGAGKQRRILLLATADEVGTYGTRAGVASSDSQGVMIRHGVVDFVLSDDGDWFEADVIVEGRRHGATSTVTASLGNLRAETSVSVRRDQSGPMPPQIKLAAMGSPVRGTFETDPSGLITITINASHPATRRYFGPQPDFPGQETVAARMLIAEIVADLTVLDVLRRHLRQQRLAAEELYARRYRMLNELLPLCHASQVADLEVVDSTSTRRRKSSARPVH